MVFKKEYNYLQSIIKTIFFFERHKTSFATHELNISEAIFQRNFFSCTQIKLAEIRAYETSLTMHI